jgi:hypothetical protein
MRSSRERTQNVTTLLEWVLRDGLKMFKVTDDKATQLKVQSLDGREGESPGKGLVEQRKGK